MTMEKEECWATFLTSGKVTDYLNYRQANERENGGSYKDDCTGRLVQRQRDSDDKVTHNAGFY